MKLKLRHELFCLAIYVTFVYLYAISVVLMWLNKKDWLPYWVESWHHPRSRLYKWEKGFDEEKK